MSGILYLVATPIGNMEDITYRAVRTLTEVDFIAAEDTRVTMKLLSRYNIKNELISYHEHNKRESGEKIVSRLSEGQTCALVTDAGMPAISDPGEELVLLCREHGIEVYVIPGASAVVSAAALSGLTGGRFTFEGFLTTAKTARREHLAALKNESRAMIFYEAPHKLTRTLRDLYETLGDRKISLSRELTKIHEETIAATLSEAIKRYASSPPKGEFTFVVEGIAPKKEAPDIHQALAAARELMENGISLSEASRRISSLFMISRHSIYEELSKDRHSQ